MAAPDNRILIAGGGIGGLSAALALTRQGAQVHVLEREAVFGDEGAGIQLGPNATRILREWGVLDRLRPKAVFSQGIAIGDGPSGEHLATVPFGDRAEQRYGAPFILVHRADLHQALLETARAFSGFDITMGCEVKSYDQFPGEIIVATDKNTVHGRAFIAADGLWSRLRRQINQGAALQYAGKTAWRTWVNPKDLPENMRGAWTGLWLAKDAHLVHYPVRAGDKINVVAVIDEARGYRAEGWNVEADADVLLPRFAGWAANPAQIVRSGAAWRKWPLFYLPPLRRWTHGAATMIGDAAHPVLPFLAQGGAMAIEDANALARILAEHEDEAWPAFVQFEAERIERTARTSYESRKMGKIYHMGGLLRLARNFVLRRKSPEALLRKFDWLYRTGAED